MMELRIVAEREAMKVAEILVRNKYTVTLRTKIETLPGQYSEQPVHYIEVVDKDAKKDGQRE
jgi:hypothetical protein